MSGYYYTDDHYPDEKELSYQERMERWRKEQFDRTIRRTPTDESNGGFGR
jgi:hypothetical protein